MDRLMTHMITDAKIHTVSIPAKATHSHGSGDVSAINSVLLELTTDTGLTGWGEASPWPVFTGTCEGAASALHTHLRPLYIGADPTQVEPIMTRAEATLVGHPEAKAALETALLDLTGQITGLSIANLLGGTQRTQIPMSFSIANPNFDADLEDVAALWADGVRLFKLKTGFNDHAFDLMRLEKLRAKYGDEIRLRIDYNQGLNGYEALPRVKDLEAFAPDFVEQPVKMHERAVMAQITAATTVPIMADESVFNPREAFEAAQNKTANIFSLKIMKSGGLRRGLEVAAIARAAGIGIYGGCMFETSIAHAAGAHLCAAVPDLHLGCEFYMSTYYAAEDIATEKFPVKQGLVHVSTGPGLGVRPDLEKLAKYRVSLWE